MALSATTDGDGLYTLGGLVPGVRTVTAADADFGRRISRRLEVEPGVNTLDLQFEGSEVSGYVRDEGGEPIAGARVHLRGVFGDGHAQSSADGSFIVSDVADGRYRALASKEGFAEGEAGREIWVDGGPVSDVEIRLGRGGAVVGRILGLDSEELAQVRVLARNPGRSRHGLVKHDGAYEIPNLAPGDWSVSAQLADRRVQEHVRLEAGVEETVVDLEFGQGLTLTGQVLADGEPLIAARVALIGIELSVSRFGATDYRGEFLFGDLESGTYRLGVGGHGEEIDLAGDQSILVEISTGRVSGRVIDDAVSEPLAGAAVTVEPLVEGQGWTSGSAPRSTSDFDGRFLFDRVPEGAYRLIASKEGYASAEEMVDLTGSSASEELELRMTPTEGLVLQIEPVSGFLPPLIFAAVLDPEGRALVIERGALDAKGRVRLASVPSGTWDLLVAGPGTATVRLRARAPGSMVPVALPEAAHLEVRVPELGSSNARATLRLLGSYGSPIHTLSSGRPLKEWELQMGQVTVSGLPSGTWAVVVTTPGGLAWSSAVTTRPGVLQRIVLE
jgi:hypothetical protein